MRTIKFLRDIGAGDGSGGTGKSLADIVDFGKGTPPAVTEGVEEDGITLKPGYVRNTVTGEVKKDPNYKESNPGMNPKPNPDKQQASTATEGLNADGTLQEGYIRDALDNVIKDPNFKPTLPEGVNEDGSLQPGYKKEADGTVMKDPDYKPEDDNNDADEETKFYEAVEAITGVKYEVEYPEGISPISPEGVAIRDKVIADQAALAFENYLKESNPRAYAYMLHRSAGGTDEDFFGDNKGFQLPTLEDVKAKADVQAQVYKQELIAVNKLDATTAQLLIDAAIKDNTLATKAEAAFGKLDKAQKDQLAALDKLTKDQEKQLNESVQKLTTTISTAIKTDLGFVVPEADQPAFQKFITDNLRYDEGKFFLVQEMQGDKMKTLLESLFYQFKNGDLSKLITKEAKTKAAQHLKLKLTPHKATPGGGGKGENYDPTNLPLSKILPSQGS